MSQLRHMPAYRDLIDAAKVDGADMLATLLTHVGWNEPEGRLSIHQSTSRVGLEAFAAVGFSAPGPTDASIHEVLTRAAAWSSLHGHAEVSRRVQRFIDSTWPNGLAEMAPIPGSDDNLAESAAVDDSDPTGVVRRPPS